MKKCSVVLILLFILFISGCSYNSYNLNNKKPSAFYYTNLLENDLASGLKADILLLDMNFYKERPLQPEEVVFIKEFFKYMDKSSFIQKPRDLPKKPLYKYFFTFTETKYVINIYNEKYISVYPWDGDYPEDYVSMEKAPRAYNLYNLCKYFIPRY